MANDQDSRVQRLDEVLKIVRAKVAPDMRSLLERFVQQYFSRLDPEDLAERQPADLYGAALSHWNFARKRDPGSVRLRVFNPSIEEHGWQSTHTIIEIVNDDMPFLVDSVTMEVNRHGLTLHLIMHPIIAVKRSADGTLVDLASDDDQDARSRTPRDPRPHVVEPSPEVFGQALARLAHAERGRDVLDRGPQVGQRPILDHQYPHPRALERAHRLAVPG